MKQPIWKTSKSHRETLIKDVCGWVDGSSDRSATSSLFALLDKSIKVSIAIPKYWWFLTWITSSRPFIVSQLTCLSKCRSRSVCGERRPNDRRNWATSVSFTSKSRILITSAPPLRFSSGVRSSSIFERSLVLHCGSVPLLSWVANAWRASLSFPFHFCPFWSSRETLTLNVETK